MNVLHLTLEKKWFDMILSGEKKEEYREFKPYWIKRLCTKHPMSVIVGGDLRDLHTGQNFSFKNFDEIIFKNGYGKNVPTMKVECRGVEVAQGKQEWGAPDYRTFILKLGDVVHVENVW